MGFLIFHSLTMNIRYFNVLFLHIVKDCLWIFSMFVFLSHQNLSKSTKIITYFSYWWILPFFFFFFFLIIWHFSIFILFFTLKAVEGGYACTIKLHFYLHYSKKCVISHYTYCFAFERAKRFCWGWLKVNKPTFFFSAFPTFAIARNLVTCLAPSANTLWFLYGSLS